MIPLLDEDVALASVLGVIGGVAEASDRVAPIEPAQDLHAELAALRLFLSRRFATKSLVCHSDAMLRVAEQMTIARSTGSPVLIWGEQGCGKEHLARTIHYESESRTRAFIPLDCQSLSPLEPRRPRAACSLLSGRDTLRVARCSWGPLFVLLLQSRCQ